ncbi:MAG: YdcF family protein [Deltaproteobacteria bacterium]|nr:YdcF family protein [Deltaproteobacteria bacterium]
MRRPSSVIIKILKWFSFVSTACGLIVVYTPAANVMARPLIVDERLAKSGVIVVLGGGAYENGALGAASNERLIRGLLLYKNGWAPAVIFSGGSINAASTKIIHTITASDDKSAISASEAAIMRDTALTLGVPEKDTAVDALSTNTYENMKDVKGYMETRGIKTCLIVTSPTHALRSMLVAERLGMSCSPAPVADYTALRRSAIDRLSLFHAVVWEYAGLALYKVYGYI